MVSVLPLTFWIEPSVHFIVMFLRCKDITTLRPTFLASDKLEKTHFCRTQPKGNQDHCSSKPMILTLINQLDNITTQTPVGTSSLTEMLIKRIPVRVSRTQPVNIDKNGNGRSNQNQQVTCLINCSDVCQLLSSPLQMPVLAVCSTAR